MAPLKEITGTVSLEKAKALKEVGYPQDETFLFWLQGNEEKGWYFCDKENWIIQNDEWGGGPFGEEGWHKKEKIAKPSVEEILQKLPSITIKIIWHKGAVDLIEICNAEGEVLFLSAARSSLVDVLADFYISQHKLSKSL